MTRTNAARATVPAANIEQRVAAIDWEQVSQDLDAEGHGIIKHIISRDECEATSALFQQDDLFRSRVVMERHRFGRGEYKYFKYPLPDLVASLRTAVYPHLVPIANRWNEALGINGRYPTHHADYIERCHQTGQHKPTPLILK